MEREPSGDTCVVVVPLDRRELLYDKLYKLAVRQAGLVPEASAAHPTEWQRLQRQIATAAVVLVDTRSHDSLSYYALGIADTYATPMVVVTDSRHELPVTVDSQQVIEFETETDDPTSGERLREAVIQKLTHRAEIEDRRGTVGTVWERRGVEGASPRLEYTRREAESAINAMWIDGLSPDTIMNEMLRAGVPASWAEVCIRRLSRRQRPGW